METTMLLNVSRQVSLRRTMDVIANNLANLSTTAYKAESVLFKEEIKEITRENGQKDTLAFAIDYGTKRNFEEGQFAPTGNNFDLAISGKGFFVVETDEGPQYTRNGHMGLDLEGRLVTRDGYPVLDADGREIVLGEGQTELSVSSNGTINLGGEEDAVQIGVVTFDNLRSLKKAGGSLYKTQADPKPSEDFQILQGQIEGSNVKPIMEMARMIDTLRAYERASQNETKTDDLSRKAIDKLGQVRA